MLVSATQELDSHYHGEGAYPLRGFTQVRQLGELK